MSNLLSYENINELDDFSLFELAKKGNRLAEEILTTRYLYLARQCSRKYFLAGADGEDLIQEATIGLVKAIREFDENKNIPPESFLRICINRRIFTVVKSAASLRHNPLNAYIPIENLFDEYSHMDTPELYVINKEGHEEMSDKILSVLTGLEKKVLNYYLDGISYLDIANKLGKNVKSVDNAIQRIRRKTAIAIKGDNRQSGL